MLSPINAIADRMMNTGSEKLRVKERMSRLRRPAFIFLVALILRFLVTSVLLAHSPFSWGRNEPAAIARSLVKHHGFAGAFHDSPGPTAWLAPVYPALLACIFRAFGIETSASTFVTILLNSIFASLTAAVLFYLGKAHFGERAGLVAAWAWALAPPLLFTPWLPWETCFSGLVLPFALLPTLGLGAASRLRDWVWCGTIWGFAALLNPSLLAPLPALTACLIWQWRRWNGVLVMVLVCVACVLPWTARNYLVFHHFIPVRSNFWPEVYFGNVSFSLHPTGNSMLYQREGEILYASDLKERTLAFVRSNPTEFWKLTAERVIAFWTLALGPRIFWLTVLLLALAGLVRAALSGRRWVEFGSVLLFYPLVYYITFSFARYRYPIEPVIYLVAGHAISELLRLRHARLGPKV
jgi:hypothetical protein